MRTSNTVKRKSFPGSRAVTFPSTTVLPSWPFQATGLPACQSDSRWNGEPPLKSGTHSAVYSGAVRTCQTFETGALISIDLFTKSLDMVPAFITTIPGFPRYVPATKYRESTGNEPFDDSRYTLAGFSKGISLPPKAATRSPQKVARQK